MNRMMNFSSFDENDVSASIVAIKRRNEDEQRRFTRLLTDLSRSFDSSNDHYEIRQVQQQFSIELPLPQAINKHKLPYGKTWISSIEKIIIFQRHFMVVHHYPHKMRLNDQQ
jgi:hypothetical protein